MQNGTSSSVKSSRDGYREKALKVIRNSLKPYAYATSDPHGEGIYEYSSASSSDSESSDASQATNNNWSSVLPGSSGLNQNLSSMQQAYKHLLAIGHSEHKSSHVSSDYVLQQFDLEMCKGRFTNCLRCTQDPHCGWDKERVECNKPHASGLLQDVTNATPGICDNCMKNKPIHVFRGQSVHLFCAIHMSDIEDMGPLRWFHCSREKGEYTIVHRQEKYIHSADHGLVILSVSEQDAGRYDCKLGTSTLCSFNITVDTKTCSASSEAEYRKIYSDWCHEFEKYKMAMKTWQAKQAKCQSVHPNDVTYQGAAFV